LTCQNGQIFRVLAFGPFESEHIHICWKPEELNIPDRLLQEIEHFWATLKHRGHFNGRISRLDRWQIQNGSLVLHLSPSDYRTLLYSNQYTERISNKWGERFLSRALGISAVVVSTEQQILLMKRSASMGEFPNRYDVFGGHIDVPTENSAPDVFHAMQQELHEELALKSTDYSLELLGLVESSINKKPELVFAAPAKRSIPELLHQAQTARDKNEYVQLFAVANREDALAQFLDKNSTSFTPSALASLCLYKDLFLKK